MNSNVTSLELFKLFKVTSILPFRSQFWFSLSHLSMRPLIQFDLYTFPNPPHAIYLLS
jgi:hypothetical protein